MYKKLNQLESDNGLWGGSDIIGGSPRVKGSSISPDELKKIVEECM